MDSIRWKEKEVEPGHGSELLPSVLRYYMLYREYREYREFREYREYRE